MAKSKFVWTRDIMRTVRISPMVFDELKKRGNAIAADAGPGHEVTAMITRGKRAKNRARVQVTAVTLDARRANASGHALLRALGRNRG